MSNYFTVSVNSAPCFQQIFNSKFFQTTFSLVKKLYSVIRTYVVLGCILKILDYEIIHFHLC